MTKYDYVVFQAGRGIVQLQADLDQAGEQGYRFVFADPSAVIMEREARE